MTDYQTFMAICAAAWIVGMVLFGAFGKSAGDGVLIVFAGAATLGIVGLGGGVIYAVASHLFGF